MHAAWLVTIIFGVVASLIAHGKGRNSFGWFSAGVFLGPFSMIVAFLPPVERPGVFAKCPACREIIRAEADRCRFCHTAVGRV